DILGMICDTCPVERSIYFDVVAEGVLDRLALEVFVGVSRTGDAIPTQPSIQRPTGMNMRFAEVGVALGVRLGEDRCALQRRCESAENPDRRQCRASSHNLSSTYAGG